MRKVIKKIIIAILILISNFAILSNTVQALENGQIPLYTKGNLSRILKYDGIIIKTAYVVYAENGKEYPAYCLNKDLQGVGDNTTYSTENQGKITDIGLWRVIINGYPYKSLKELGVVSEEEAYIATKQSIYCYLYNRGTEKYSGIGDSGTRTVNAMNTILLNAKNSNENFDSQKIETIESEKWIVDKYKKEYISKEYQIKSNINISKYSIQLENEPEGSIITDIKNNKKQEFNSKESFKILIPIKNLEESGNFKINIKTQMETKPIFYGKAPSNNLQDYALTAFSYEDINTELGQEYYKNNTKIIIEKEDKETAEKLKGAIFEILDEAKNKIKTVTTDEKGMAEINQILPGIYYIREVQSPEGYEENQELTKVEIKLNETQTLKVKNKKIIVEIPEPVIEQIKEVRKLPVTGM